MFKELKREAYEANVALPRHGLINLTFGNASAIDRARAAFAIKPSGVDYTALTPEDMVVIDLEGRRIEGRLNPSSDTPTHRRLFLAFPNIGGVVHTHSSHATAFAQAGRPIPIFGTTHADYFNGEVPVTRKMRPSEIATDYEWETGNVIVETMRNRDPADFPGVLVNRHAPFTWGASVAKALENAVAVECIAQMALMSLQLAPNLEPIEEELLNKHFKRKHGAGAYYGQTPDFEAALTQGTAAEWPAFWRIGCDGRRLQSLFRAISRGCGAISESSPRQRRRFITSTYVFKQIPCCLARPRHVGSARSGGRSKPFKRRPDRPPPACSHPDALSDSRRPGSADNARPRPPPRSSELFRPSRPDSGRRKRRSNTALCALRLTTRCGVET